MPAPATSTTQKKTPARKAASVAGGIPRKPATRAPGKAMSATAAAARATPPVPTAANGVSPFEIMAARIANRVAEMAENVTFVERPQRAEPEAAQPAQARKPPRKLEIRLPPTANANGVRFSAPFLDNLLGKMLALQNRMLLTGKEIAASETQEGIKHEQFQQSAELSRIIALICAEKARQGVDMV